MSMENQERAPSHHEVLEMIEKGKEKLEQLELAAKKDELDEGDRRWLVSILGDLDNAHGAWLTDNQL